jgi:hypothetical protein
MPGLPSVLPLPDLLYALDWPKPGEAARPVTDRQICHEKRVSLAHYRRMRAAGIMPAFFLIGKRAHRTMSDKVDAAFAALEAGALALPAPAAQPEAMVMTAEPNKRGPGRPRKPDSQLKHPRRARKSPPAGVEAAE